MTMMYFLKYKNSLCTAYLQKLVIVIDLQNM